MDFSLGNYYYLLLLLVLLVLGFILMRFVKWRNKRKNLFANTVFQDELFPKTKRFSKFVPVLYLIALLFLIFSIVDVLSGKEMVKSEQKMNNVMFLLDVSNSMNAEDIKPSRLEEAKNIVINALPQMGNDRIGVVVFAGEASSIMPLTTDISAAETYLAGVETSIIRNQGTDFLKAVETAVIKFKNVPKGARQIIMLSDGEDNEGNAKAAISLAKKEGIAITTIGVGTMEGGPVPEYFYGQLMGYKTNLLGETVISKLESDALKEIASSTGGQYIEGNNLDSAISSLVNHLKNKNGSTSVMVENQNAIHYYQYFLAVALLLFFIIYIFNPKRDLNF